MDDERAMHLKEMSAILVELIGGPMDGRLMAVPAIEGSPSDPVLTVLQSYAKVDYSDPNRYGYIGVRDGYYDLELTDREEGPLYIYRWRG